MTNLLCSFQLFFPACILTMIPYIRGESTGMIMVVDEIMVEFFVRCILTYGLYYMTGRPIMASQIGFNQVCKSSLVSFMQFSASYVTRMGIYMYGIRRYQLASNMLILIFSFIIKCYHDKVG